MSPRHIPQNHIFYKLPTKFFFLISSSETTRKRKLNIFRNLSVFSPLSTQILNAEIRLKCYILSNFLIITGEKKPVKLRFNITASSYDFYITRITFYPFWRPRANRNLIHRYEHVHTEILEFVRPRDECIISVLDKKKSVYLTRCVRMDIERFNRITNNDFH